jgi:hypothetical protein
VSADPRVAFRAHLERFPLAVKGALVLRAVDGLPHQVAFERAVVAEMAGGTSVPIGLDHVVQDVSPTKDLFVPFEFPFADLGSGWYRIECRVLIDGSSTTVHPGEPFVIPWPRAATRRGTVDVGVAVEAGHGKVRIGELACSADRVQVSYEAPDPIGVKLLADGRPLPTLEHEHDAETGRGALTAYPVLRAEERVSIEVRGATAPIEVRLP